MRDFGELGKSSGSRVPGSCLVGTERTVRRQKVNLDCTPPGALATSYHELQPQRFLFPKSIIRIPKLMCCIAATATGTGL